MTDKSALDDKLLHHTWYEKDVGDVVYFGRVRGFDEKEQNLNISYWKFNEVDTSAMDYGMEIPGRLSVMASWEIFSWLLISQAL